MAFVINDDLNTRGALRPSLRQGKTRRREERHEPVLTPTHRATGGNTQPHWTVKWKSFGFEKLFLNYAYRF